MFIKKINISWQAFLAFAMFALLLVQMFGLIAPLRAGDLYNTYSIVCICVCAGIYFSRKGLSGPWEVKLFIAYLAWVLITRWLNKDFYLFVDFDFVIMTLFSFLLFVMGTQLNSRQREIFLDIFTLVYAGFFVLVSIAGIFVTITDTYIHLPPEDVWITVKGNAYILSLNLLSCPTAVGASTVFIAWSLIVYQLTKRKNLFVKALLLASVIVLHITIPLFHCRSLQIVLSISYGMLALLFAIKFFNKKNASFKAIILPIITAVAFVICFLSFNWTNLLVSKIYDHSAPRFETFYDNLETKLNPDYFGIILTPEEIAELGVKSSNTDFVLKPLRTFVGIEDPTPSPLSNKAKMTDYRKFFGNATLSGRTITWKSGLIALKQHPIICIRGGLTNVFMDTVNKIRSGLIDATYDASHMHNMFFEVLMITGIPGLLLILLWTILMVKTMLKVYFDKSKGISLAIKALTIPIAGIFVFNLTEVAIFGNLPVNGICFFIIAGIFVGYYYDYFPKSAKS